MAWNGWETVGRRPGTQALGRFLLSVVVFVFVAVPLEAYVKAFLGVFDNGSFTALLVNHFFVQSASCFYSITIVVDVMVVTSSPHLRGTWISRPIFRYMAFVVILVSLLSYAGVSSAVWRGGIDAANAPNAATWTFIYWLLAIILVFSTAFYLAVHVYEYVHSLSFSNTDGQISELGESHE